MISEVRREQNPRKWHKYYVPWWHWPVCIYMGKDHYTYVKVWRDWVWRKIDYHYDDGFWGYRLIDPNDPNTPPLDRKKL